MDHNPYAAPTSATRAAPEVLQLEGPSGLGGWLVLVALGLIATPIRLAHFLLQTFPPIFRNGTWERLTTPGSENYHPLWAPLLIGEIIINCVFIAMAVYLLVLFFRKSWRFPRIYIALLISSLVFILADSAVVSVIVPEQGFMDPMTVTEFGRSLVAAAIWIPYVILSKRVRNTFVRRDT